MATPSSYPHQITPVTTCTTTHAKCPEQQGQQGEKITKAVSVKKHIPSEDSKIQEASSSPVLDIHSSDIKTVPTDSMLVPSAPNWPNKITPKLTAIETEHIDKILTADEKEQLVWVQDNTQYSPSSKAHQPDRPHSDIFRATNRLHCLELFRAGTPVEYDKFISPQRAHNRKVTDQQKLAAVIIAAPLQQPGKADKNNSEDSSPAPANGQSNCKEVLNWESFKYLSELFKELSDEQYQALRAATIINHVALSPAAIAKAESLGIAIPSDSTKFLAATADRANEIYPLAASLCQKSPDAIHWLKIAFLPDSHLRHWIHNEGGNAMYRHITSMLQDRSLSSEDLDFWFMYWIINDAGLETDGISQGSQCLTEDRCKCIKALKDIIKQHGTAQSDKLMEFYLQKRAEWLNLPDQELCRKKPLAFGFLATKFLVFDAKRGQELFNGFSRLSEEVQASWFQYTEDQLNNTTTPAPTYTPAWFNNIMAKESLESTITTSLPLFMMVIDKEKEMRESGVNPLADNIPVSFRVIANKESVERFITNKNNNNTVKSIDINHTTGAVNFIYEKEDRPANP